MDRVFLDANVLFSAAYREESGLLRLWERDDAALASSRYAIEEARVNLSEPGQRARLDALVARMEVVDGPAGRVLPAGVKLPEKDRPILLAAIAAKATHLLTGDEKHFGPYFGHEVAGMRILRPGEYMRTRRGA